MAETITNIIEIIDNLVIDKHILTECNNFITTCYNLFYNTSAIDVTFTIGTTSYTVPNVAKNHASTIEPMQGVVDPESSVSGYNGQIYYNTTNHKVFFQSSSTYSMTGWVELFQYVSSPTEDDILDNVNNLLTSSESIVTTYYDMFYNTTPKDVTIQVYDGTSGTLSTVTVPNRAKSMKVGITGAGSPEGSVTSTIGTVYVNTLNNDIFIKATTIGNTGWYQFSNTANITQHNASSTAHQGYLARINGDSTQLFSVGNPIASTHAINVNYTGSLSNLNTNSKSSLVSAINELKSDYDEVLKQYNIANAQPWTVISGNLTADGDADLMLKPTDTLDFYEDVTSSAYIDNTNIGKWGSEKGTTTDYYSWGNEGGVFGWPLGSGFHGWSKDNNIGTYANLDSRGQLGVPITHTYTTPLEAGTYMFAICGNGYSFTLKANYDGSDHTITVPSGLTSTSWSYTSTFTVTTSLSSISAEGITNIGDWGIGAIHLLKVIPNSSYSGNIDKVYFKAGAKYDAVDCATLSGYKESYPALASIDLSSTSDGTYKVFINISTGIPYLKSCNILRSKVEPSSPTTGDLWKDISVFPISVKEYNGTTWDDFEDIPMGEVTVASNKVTAVTNYPYCNRAVDTATSVSPAYIVRTYNSNGSWGRVWSNGFIEQGGQISLTTSAQSITLPISYSDTYYNIVYTCSTGTATYASKTTSGFAMTGSTSSTCTWKTTGMSNTYY